MHLAVGDQECAADPVLRHTGQRALHVLEQPRAVHRDRPLFIRFPGADDADIDIAHALKFFGQRRNGVFCLLRPVADFLRGGFVNDDRHYILVENTFLLNQDRVCHCGQQYGGGEQAEACPARLAP